MHVLIMRYKTLLLQEKFFLFAILSFVLYWLRAVGYIVNWYNIGKLIVGLLITVPLFLAVSNMHVYLGTMFGGRYKHLKLFIYTLFISFLYCIFITENINSDYSYLKLNILLTAFYFWQPVILLILGYFLIDIPKDSEFSKNVILFIVISLSLRQLSNVFIIKHFLFIRHHIQDLALLKIYFTNTVDRFNLYGFWTPSLIIIIVMISGGYSNQIGLNRKLDKNTIFFTFFAICLILLSCSLSIVFGNRQLVIEGLIWNLLTASYHALEASLFEEILFRGFLLNYFTNKFTSVKGGNIFAILITSILFGLFHYPFNTITFLQSFLYGILFGWLYYKTQNLWAPISIHYFNNLIVGAILIS